MGVICPLGNSTERLWENLCAGRSGVDFLQSLPPLENRVIFGGETRDFTGVIDNFGQLGKTRKKAIRKSLKVMCRETMMAVAAAQHAVGDAGFAEEPMDPERSGVVFGSDYMLSPPEDFRHGMTKCGVEQGNFQFSRWGTDGLGDMNPLWMLKFLPNMPASHIAIFNDLRGPNNSLTLREVASCMAIREAAQTIERGHADRMVAGATGTRIHPFKTIHAIQTEQLANVDLPPAEASRPFDKDRTGMVLGEGAGAIVLEELESARSRGATIYAEILGTGSSTVTDAQLHAQRTAALTGAMRMALADSARQTKPVDQMRGNGASVGDLTAAIGHLSAHGLGTRDCDQDEATAIAELFGKQAEQPPVVAAKSYFGNLGAGSGMVEVIASVLALGHGRLFRTLNFQSAGPECPLAVNGRDDAEAGTSFLKLSVTPQGQAAALHVGVLA